MTIEIKVSTAVTFLLGPFVDKTDGVAIETGLATAMDNASTGIRVSKNGGNMADRNDSTVPAHDEDGFYTIVLDTTDTNALGFLHVEYSEPATALPAWKDFSVVTANYWDTKYGADQFDVNVTNIIGTAPTLTNNDLDVNVASMAADTLNASALATDAVNEISRAIGIQKNATFSDIEFLMVLTSDHVSPATGLTVTGTMSIDGAAFAGVNGTIAEVANGIYQFDATADDTNGNVITYRFISATADDTFVTIKTVA